VNDLKFPIARLSLISSLLIFILLGCGGSETPKPEPELTELVQSGAGFDTSLDTPEGVLFAQAKRFYASKLFTEARESFEMLRDGYPFGAYTEFAEVKIADCYFQTREFLTAATLYEEFGKQHPSSTSLDYTTMQAGRSYLLANNGIGRDAIPLQKAVVIFEQFEKHFPDSIYRAEVREAHRDARMRVIQQELAVIDFYERTGKAEAAKIRFEELSKMYPVPEVVKAAHAGEIELALLSQENVLGSAEPATVVALAPVEIVEVARPTETAQADLQVPALLVAQWSEKQVAENSTAKVGMARLAPRQENQVAEAANTTPYDTQIRILRVDCQPEKHQILFHLSRDPKAEDELPLDQELTVKDGHLKIPTSFGVSKAIAMRCLGEVSIGTDGEIAVQTTKQAATLFSLANPPRLLLTLANG
jgi:outer membrane protein assembly factor BamD